MAAKKEKAFALPLTYFPDDGEGDALHYSERLKAVEGCCDAVGGPEWSDFTPKNSLLTWLCLGFISPRNKRSFTTPSSLFMELTSPYFFLSWKTAIAVNFHQLETPKTSQNELPKRNGTFLG